MQNGSFTYKFANSMFLLIKIKLQNSYWLKIYNLKVEKLK